MTIDLRLYAKRLDDIDLEVVEPPIRDAWKALNG